MPFWNRRNRQPSDLERRQQSERDRQEQMNQLLNMQSQAASFRQPVTLGQDYEHYWRARIRAGDVIQMPSVTGSMYQRYFDQLRYYESMQSIRRDIWLRDAPQDTNLEYWYLSNGDRKLITELHDSELQTAIKMIKNGNSCGRQKNKIISLEKERKRRDVLRTV